MSWLKLFLFCFVMGGGGVAYAGNPASVDYVNRLLAPGNHFIGEYAEGGVIFWLSPDKKHGIVASIDNMGGSGDGATYLWSSDQVMIGAKANTMAFGPDYQTAGQINTALILTHYEGSAETAPAAQACAAYSVTVNGVTYDDWYLPSLEELGMMMSNQAIIESVSAAHGGAAFVSANYWSSFELNNISAWRQVFSDGGQTTSAKASNSFRVRAARAF